MKDFMFELGICAVACALIRFYDMYIMDSRRKDDYNYAKESWKDGYEFAAYSMKNILADGAKDGKTCKELLDEQKDECYSKYFN